jgi:hypothetical protein
MALETTIIVAQATGNGITSSFVFAGKFNEDTHLAVTLTDTTTGEDDAQVLGSDYTVSGAGDAGGGTVIFTTPPPTGMRITIRRTVPLTQPTVFPNNGKIPSETIEDRLDELAMGLQQVNEIVKRAARFRPSELTTSDPIFPALEDRMGKFLRFNPDTGALEAVIPDSEADADSAAASAIAASASQSSAASSASTATTAKNLAEKWASELEDVVVEGGKFSAFHWAQKAEDIVEEAGLGDMLKATYDPTDSGKVLAAEEADHADHADLADVATLADEATAVEWDGVLNKPSTFTPASHTHPLSELTQSGATTGQIAKWNGSAWAPAAESASIAEPIIILSDVKAANTAGGTFTSGAWHTRTLNTEVLDSDNHCSLSVNQFTLTAGTYDIFVKAPAFRCGGHMCRLYNATDAAVIAYGTTEFTDKTGTYAVTNSLLRHRFTIGASKALRIEHRNSDTRTTDGYGLAANIGVDERYTLVELKKVG